MENNIMKLLFIGCLCLLIVPIITIIYKVRINNYKCEIKIIFNKIKLLNNDSTKIENLLKEKEILFDKIHKCCSHKFILKCILGILGVGCTAVYFGKQLIYNELFSDINPLNELVELLKTNNASAKDLESIQKKISVISFNEKPSLNMYLFGQILLASFALNDISGNGVLPYEEYMNIRNSLESLESKGDAIKK